MALPKLALERKFERDSTPFDCKVGEVTLPVLREFSSVSRFWRSMGAVETRVEKRFLPVAGFRGWFPEVVLDVYELQKTSSDEEIHRNFYTGFVQIRHLLDRHKEGDEEVQRLALDDGYPNYFYVIDKERYLWSMEVVWMQTRKAWAVDMACAGTRPIPKIPGGRVFRPHLFRASPS